MRQDEEFTPLQIVKKNLLDSSRSMYRVYKSPTEFVTVEAATALEAMRESGIKAPYKIKRQIRFEDRLMGLEKLTEAEDIIETVQMEPPLSIAGHTEPVPTAGVEQTKEVVKEAHELKQAEEGERKRAGEDAAVEPHSQPAEEAAHSPEENAPEQTEAAQPEEAAAEDADADESELSEEEIAKLLDS